MVFSFTKDSRAESESRPLHWSRTLPDYAVVERITSPANAPLCLPCSYDMRPLTIVYSIPSAGITNRRPPPGKS
jgi:hypothetical protein